VEKGFKEWKSFIGVIMKFKLIILNPKVHVPKSYSHIVDIYELYIKETSNKKDIIANE